MKYCTKCGAQNEDYAYTCTQCNSNFTQPVNHSVNKNINANTVINLFGILNGMISFVLGIVTFSKSSLSKDVERLLLSEMGDVENVDAIFDLLFAPSRAFSFGMGSLLIVVGVFLVLYFANKMIAKKKDKF